MLDEKYEKYEKYVYKNINKENMYKIINLLSINGCYFIDELLENYLDLFTIEYNTFENKYNILNKKYNNNLIDEISKDMNILEEFMR